MSYDAAYLAASMVNTKHKATIHASITQFAQTSYFYLTLRRDGRVIEHLDTADDVRRHLAAIA